MIAASRSVKVIAVSAACCAHAAALWAFVGTVEIRMEGDAGAPDVAQLGNSFADMAAGTLSAVEPSETTPQTQPTEAEPVETAPRELVEPRQAETVTEAAPPETAQPEQVQESAPVVPVENMAVAALPVTPAEAIQPDTAKPAQPEPLPRTPPEASEVIEAEDTPEPAVTRSKRPQPRSAEFEKRHEAKPKPKVAKKEPTPQKAQPQPRGNANQNARAGAATGREHAKAKAQGRNTGKSTQSGNAAASNYPGKVMRKISRVPKPRVGRRGTAVVSFTISSGGGLSAVSLARSSGSGQLDQAALQVIRRAAPFPAPPPGARRNFSIRIQGG